MLLSLLMLMLKVCSYLLSVFDTMLELRALVVAFGVADLQFSRVLSVEA